jgi:hypothetical protein
VGAGPLFCDPGWEEGGFQPGGLKKFYFYNEIKLFLAHLTRHHDFRDVCFDFELDPEE